MRDDDFGLTMQAGHAQEDLVAELWMTLDNGPLGGIERTRLVEDRIGNANLADVVKQAGPGEGAQGIGRQLHGASDSNGQFGHPGVMALGVLVLGFDRRGQRGDRFGMLELHADLDLQFERGFHHRPE